MHGPVCSECGQREAQPIAVRRVLDEFRDHLVGLDFRLLRTARELLIAPGPMIRGYIAGRRVRYTNPFKLLFLVATLYLAVVTLLDVQLTPSSGNQETATAVVALVNYLVYLFLVPTAWLLRLLFSRRYTWAESYVVVCFLWSGYLLISCGLAVAMIPLDRWYFFGRTAAGLAYLVPSLRSVFESRWIAAIWKGAALYAGYFVATFVVMGLIIFLSHLLGLEFLPLGPRTR